MTNMNKEEKTLKDWHYETEEDRIIGVETVTYSNGHDAKRFKLSDGRLAIVRELSGAESIQVNKLMAGNPDNQFPAMMHYAVKIDGKQLPMEDFPTMRAKDFNRLHMQVMLLNF